MRFLQYLPKRQLSRYFVIVGVLSALAGAQQTLQLSPAPATNCSEATATLTCHWADASGCTKTQPDVFSLADPVACLSNSSIQVVIADDGINQTVQTDSCEPTLTVDNGCGNFLSSPIQTDIQFVPDSDGAAECTQTGTIVRCISPIIVDTAGRNFLLTSARDGVRFDIRGDGHPIQIAWTAAGSGNAFLALDRNHNGAIDDGTELFGNFTQQPKSSAPNGFLALAEFDKAENGGNADGIIDARDAVFSHLVLWIDENHDGISQTNELHPLPELGVVAFSLNYKESGRRDEFGNFFHFGAKLNPNGVPGQSKAGPWTYDVFLVTK
jgi:hypothetical protein